MDTRNKEAKFTHGFCARDYGQAISAQIEVNCIIGALQGEWYDSGKRENTKLCQIICNLGDREARHHRRFGSSWIFIGLYCAYIGASSARDKRRVAKLLEDYTHAFSGEATEVQTIEMEQLATYLNCNYLTL